MTVLAAWLKPKALLPAWVALALLVDPMPPSAPAWLGEIGTRPAFADDDDGGGDDDGGASRSSSGGSRLSRQPPNGPSLFRALRERFAPRARERRATNRARRPAPARASRPAPVAERARDEIVAIGLGAGEIERLQAAGVTVIDSTEIAVVGSEMLRLRVPPGMSLEAALTLVRETAPQSLADFSHYYRPGQQAAECSAPHCAAVGLIGWPAHATLPAGCGGNITIGLIDTAINPAHAAFAAGQVEVLRLVDDSLPESGRQHGTAVAALLVGGSASRAPGLLPRARLVAVDAFHRGDRQDDRANVYDLVRGLDLLSRRGVQVTNMSLSGPANVLLEQLVKRLAERGMVIVAAAGNEGPKARPVYPAAYADVIAVTAVDRGKRAYRRAGRGEHIDLSAPGVDIWTAASVSGARMKTGTSFAAPFVTAVVALMKSADSGASVAAIQDALGKSAEDLGEPGKDAVFGWGLLNARAVCAVPPDKPM